MKNLTHAEKLLIEELKTNKRGKLIWGLLDIFALPLFIQPIYISSIPITIGVVRLLAIPKINKKIQKIKLS